MGRNVRITQADKYFVVCKQAGILQDSKMKPKLWRENFRHIFSPQSRLSTSRATEYTALTKYFRLHTTSQAMRPHKFIIKGVDSSINPPIDILKGAQCEFRISMAVKKILSEGCIQNFGGGLQIGIL